MQSLRGNFISSAAGGLALANEECDVNIPVDSCAQTGGAFRFSGQLNGELPLLITGAIVSRRRVQDPVIWYSPLSQLAAYWEAAHDATVSCLRDGSLPLNPTNIAKCIREEFSEAGRFQPPQVVGVAVEHAGSVGSGTMLSSQYGGVMLIWHRNGDDGLFRLNIPDGSPGGYELTFGILLLPPVVATV